jgi:hypothetical protein
MASKAPLIVTCPACRTDWELTQEEANGKNFTCAECQTTFEIAPERGEEKPGRVGVLRGLSGSLMTAGVLLALDVLLYGSFLFSFFVGPIWLLFAIAKAIVRRNNWALALKRVLIPLITLGVVFGNAWLQSRVARVNAELIIDACARYKTNTGVYPAKLGDLVPGYMRSVPRAKYALLWGDFFYMDYKDQHSLMWIEIPPFGRPFYDFEKAKWGFLD